MRRGLYLLAVLAACGDDGTGNTVHLDSGACWPLNATPGGTAEAGTGDVMFEAMPTTLMVVTNSAQSDPFLVINARMSGMPPGDKTDPFDPKNPHTKVTIEIPDLGLTLGPMCPATLGYVASAQADTYELSSSLHIGFGMFPVAMANGKQAQITLEIVGANGLYAKDVKTVTLSAPLSGVAHGQP